MGIENVEARTASKWAGVGWVVSFLLVAGTFAVAFVSEKPTAILFIPAAIGVVGIIVSTALGRPGTGETTDLYVHRPHDADRLRINPGSGLAMTGSVDSAGNPYGGNTYRHGVDGH